MKKIYPLALLAFQILFLNQVHSQVNPALAEGLQAILDEYAGSAFPGVSTTLILPDDCSWTGISGDAGPGDPVDMNRKWHFASTTKAMTACILLQLHEEGVLDINDPISMYLDTDTINYVGPDITLKMLMNHTTDLTKIWNQDPATDLWNAVWADPDSVWNIWDVLDYTLPPTPNPDMEHRYRGLVNYLLLGFVIENATGNSLSEEFQDRIFDPLEMEDSYLGTDGVDMSDINGTWNGNTYQGNFPRNAYLSTRGASAWLISSTHDVATFIRAFHHDEMVSPELMAEARTKTAGDPPILPTSCLGDGAAYYGYGTHILEYVSEETGDTTLLFGHGGTGLGNSLSFHLAEYDMTLSVSCNDYSDLGAYYTANLMSDIFCYLIANMELTGCQTAVSENTRNEISIYPNPGTNKLFVELGETGSTAQVQLVSLSGRVLDEKIPVGNNIYFNTENLGKGIYFVRITASSSVSMQMWVKER